MSYRQDRHLVVQAILMALWQRQIDRPVILHSHRGQFTSDAYQRVVKDQGVICRMSAVGSCADTSIAKSFFGVLKRERVKGQYYQTRS